jgi:hypothetical protein
MLDNTPVGNVSVQVPDCWTSSSLLGMEQGDPGGQHQAGVTDQHASNCRYRNRDLRPADDRNGSKPVSLEVSKCFPFGSDSGHPICALGGTRHYVLRLRSSQTTAPRNGANFGIGTLARLPVCAATASNNGPIALTVASAPGIVEPQPVPIDARNAHAGCAGGP